MREEQNKGTALEYKRHDEFFSSLNRKLDEISLVGEMCYKDINYIFEYYAKIKNLYNKHISYLSDREKIGKQLLEIQYAIYNPDFLKDLKKNTMTAKRYQFTIFNKLQEIYTIIIDNFPRSELLPKPILPDKRPGIARGER